MKFESLVSVIEHTHVHFQQQAFKAVNVSLTIRNWLIGFYIVEFEQKGEDRAAYGEKLLKSIADRISLRGLSETNLKLSRQFYQAYPQMRNLLESNFNNLLSSSIHQTITDELQSIDYKQLSIRQMASDELKEIADGSKTDNYYRLVLERISFSHFIELIKIEDKTKRNFYELFILKTTPSVIELKRQINTLAFERVGLSKKLELAHEDLLEKISPELPEHAIKSIYTFDFLGLNADSLIEEKDLEIALLNHLQAFIQELGHGFCFEHRQKRILIDDEYFFADLVFYHRILKCHVIIELKVDAFKQEHLSQLNTYVAFYNAEIKQTDDNPAIGILLCTEKGKKLVEYATAGMDNQLFVSKYLVELPKIEQLESFILKEREGIKKEKRKRKNRI
jgi:predicted nuclease of restriction endonuclease-like (RecB) superfamily